MSADQRFPLGAPINRQKQPASVPIAGRPNWFTDGKGGAPFYGEQVKPPQGAVS